MKEYWFKSKKYGYGWYPANRKGWALTAGYVITIFLFAIFINSIIENKSSQLLAFFSCLLVATIAFILIVKKFGEPI